MPPAVGAGVLLASGAIAAGGQIAGSALSAHAAGSAAKRETEASNYAAAAQAKAAADALAFQKEQAAQDLAIAEATRKANYDQWAAKQGRLSNLSVLTGAGRQEIPAYSPIPTASAPPQGTPAPNLIRPQAPAAPYQTSMASLVAGDQYRPSPSGAPVAQPPIQPTGAGNMVMMKAKTGQTKLVPAEHVPYYQQNFGATVIG